MKYIHILLLILVSITTHNDIYAQSIKKHYVSKPQSDGTIYFTYPVELFKSENDGALKYDVTYKDNQDQLATINMTYMQSEMVDADSITISYNDDNLISGKVTRIYAEPDKNTWTHRYTFKSSLKNLHKFYNGKIQPEITIFAKNKPFVKYKVINGAWKDYAPVGRKIIDVILVNQR